MKKWRGVFAELTKAEASFSANPSAFDKTLREEPFGDISVLNLNADADSDLEVLYIHGS